MALATSLQSLSASIIKRYGELLTLRQTATPSPLEFPLYGTILGLGVGSPLVQGNLEVIISGAGLPGVPDADWTAVLRGVERRVLSAEPAGMSGVDAVYTMTLLGRRVKYPHSVTISRITADGGTTSTTDGTYTPDSPGTTTLFTGSCDVQENLQRVRRTSDGRVTGSPGLDLWVPPTLPSSLATVRAGDTVAISYANGGSHTGTVDYVSLTEDLVALWPAP